MNWSTQRTQHPKTNKFKYAKEMTQGESPTRMSLFAYILKHAKNNLVDFKYAMY